jgi:hypothetical protein
MGGIRIASRLPGDKFAQVAQKSKPCKKETPSRRRNPSPLLHTRNLLWYKLNLQLGPAAGTKKKLKASYQVEVVGGWKESNLCKVAR